MAAGVSPSASRELDGGVAGVEEDPGQWLRSRQVREKGRDLLGGEHVGMLLGRSRRTRSGAVQLSRAKPTWAIQKDAQPATMGCPAPVARGVGVERALGTGLERRSAARR
jgi:hypothetical protein